MDADVSVSELQNLLKQQKELLQKIENSKASRSNKRRPSDIEGDLLQVQNVVEKQKEIYSRLVNGGLSASSRPPAGLSSTASKQLPITFGRRPRTPMTSTINRPIMNFSSPERNRSPNKLLSSSSQSPQKLDVTTLHLLEQQQFMMDLIQRQQLQIQNQSLHINNAANPEVDPQKTIHELFAKTTSLGTIGHLLINLGQALVKLESLQPPAPQPGADDLANTVTSKVMAAILSSPNRMSRVPFVPSIDESRPWRTNTFLSSKSPMNWMMNESVQQVNSFEPSFTPLDDGRKFGNDLNEVKGALEQVKTIVDAIQSLNQLTGSHTKTVNHDEKTLQSPSHPRLVASKAPPVQATPPPAPKKENFVRWEPQGSDVPDLKVVEMPVAHAAELLREGGKSDIDGRPVYIRGDPEFKKNDSMFLKVWEKGTSLKAPHDWGISLEQLKTAFWDGEEIVVRIAPPNFDDSMSVASNDIVNLSFKENPSLFLAALAYIDYLVNQSS
eukprot:GDKJ01058326.1.p1 GENE.GDKJ01058326.1~~GDKJ01058326.1.p1  ORF type:complete len:498 (-),score=97.03 GDKJ01058326.1:236-1729(-)